MGKVRIKHEGKTQVIELDGSYTKEDRKLLEKLGIIEEVKPKKKYKNVKNEKGSESDSDIEPTNEDS